MTRRSRYTRGSCGTRWAVDTVQVHIVYHVGAEGSSDVQNARDIHHTQTKIVGRDGTLEAIQRARGIDDHYAVTRHVRQLGGDR